MAWVMGSAIVVDVIVKTIKVVGGGYVHVGRDMAFTNSPFYSAIGFFEGVGSIALVIACIAYFSLLQKGDARASLWKRIAWGIFIIQVAYAIPACTRTLIVTPIVLYLLIRSYFIPFKIWKLGLIGFVTAVMIFPFGNICRNVIPIGGYLSGDPKYVPEYAIKMNRMERFGNFTAESFLGRINQSVIFTKIIEKNEPPRYGESFKDFFISLGPPRILWASKPIISGDGNKLGHELGILNTDDTTTSIAPAIVGDWYMNFGVGGIIGGMLLVGMVWRGIWHYLIPYSSSLSGVMMYSILWIQLIKGMEHSIAPLYAGVVKTFVLLLIVHLLLTKQQLFSIRKFLKSA